ncbi:very short patch repair endonuclease [Methylobacterium gossipiicola]|uniref:very short patch repair endonuclease n=1 Tax=Methylobacterium gossipiicola TaxID=582675 RepID=UPI000B83105F|nr:DNA mismatch endonuclease Vsr [Methylobacterium gossipiicola]
MADHVSSEKRSAIMRSIVGKDTAPEIVVRKAAHRLGLRFRKHDSKLPGRPDLVLAKWRTVIFVNGCFWHRHLDCRRATIPKSNIEFWVEKFNANTARDERNYAMLADQGWRVVVLWQCEVRTIEMATEMLRPYFSASYFGQVDAGTENLS